MKKTIGLVVMLFVMIIATSCGDANKEKLKKEIVLAKLNCPYPTYWGMMEDISYDENTNTVEVKYQINERPDSTMTEDLEDKEYLKKMMMLNMATSQESKDILAMLKNAHASFTAIYRFSGIDKEIKLKFTDQDIDKMLDPTVNDLELKEEMLKLQIKKANAKMAGTEFGPFTFISITYDGSNVVYEGKVDEKMLGIKEIEDNNEDLKSGYLEDPDFLSVLEQTTEIGKGVRLKFIGSKSGKEAEISFDYNDLPSQRK